jgi:WD40 repeat protein
LIASGSGDRTVRIWDIERNEQMMVLTIEDGVTTVAISPDNRFVAAGSLDKSVRVWDTATGALVQRLEGESGHKDSVYSVAFAPNGQELVSGSLDKTIKMWDLRPPPASHMMGRGQPAQLNGKCVRTFEGHKVCCQKLTVNISEAYQTTGFCIECCPYPGWPMGPFGLKRSWRAILGSAYGNSSAHAARPQKFG